VHSRSRRRSAEVFRHGMSRRPLHVFNVLITRAGFPAATHRAGMSLVTTLPAPITALVPMCTPFRIVTFRPSQTSSSITTGAGSPLLGSSECQSVSVITVLAPHRTRLPSSIRTSAPIVTPLNPHSDPITSSASSLSVEMMHLWLTPIKFESGLDLNWQPAPIEILLPGNLRKHGRPKNRLLCPSRMSHHAAIIRDKMVVLAQSTSPRAHADKCGIRLRRVIKRHPPLKAVGVLTGCAPASRLQEMIKYQPPFRWSRALLGISYAVAGADSLRARSHLLRSKVLPVAGDWPWRASLPGQPAGSGTDRTYRCHPGLKAAPDAKQQAVIAGVVVHVTS
jgi:hypothetical protein